MMTSVAHSTDATIALLMGSRGCDGGKQYEVKVDTGGTSMVRFIEVPLLRLLTLGSGLAQWPTQSAQSVLRLYSVANSGRSERAQIYSVSEG